MVGVLVNSALKKKLIVLRLEVSTPSSKVKPSELSDAAESNPVTGTTEELEDETW